MIRIYLQQTRDDMEDGVYLRILGFQDIPREILRDIAQRLVYGDVLNLMEVNSVCYKWCLDDYLWKILLKRSFKNINITEDIQISSRELFIALSRSKVSVVGIPFPGCPKKLPKDEVVRRKIDKFQRANVIEPFWILHLGYKHHQTGSIAWYYRADHTSSFGWIACMKETQRIQVEGATEAWVAGLFHVVWRIRLDPGHFVGQLTFCTTVQGNTPISYIWNTMEAIHGNGWQEIDVGTVIIDKSHTKVRFSIHQFDLDWKYSLSIDWVSLVPAHLHWEPEFIENAM